MKRSLKQLVWLVVDQLNRRAYKAQKYRGCNERPLEYAFACECLASACPEKVLDVGPGESPWPAIMAKCGFVVVAIDQMKRYWKRRIFNQHFYVVRDDITKPKIAEKFDFITCISTLEHIPDHGSAVRSMFNLLRPGGHIVMTFPYNDRRYVDNVYKLPGAGYGQHSSHVCQVFSSKEIKSWLQQNPGRVVRQEFYEIFSGDLWTFGQRISPPRKVKRTDKHHLTAVLIRKY